MAIIISQALCAMYRADLASISILLCCGIVLHINCILAIGLALFSCITYSSLTSAPTRLCVYRPGIGDVLSYSLLAALTVDPPLPLHLSTVHVSAHSHD